MAYPPLPPVAPKRWLRVVLAVSLALNLAVVGVVAGAMISGGPHERRSDMVRDLGFGAYTEALSRQDRDALRGAFFEKAPDFRQARRDMGRDFAAVLAALRATPFDAAALADAIARQNERSAKHLALGQDLITAHITSMADAERLAFADRLEASLTRKGGKSH